MQVIEDVSGAKGGGTLEMVPDENKILLRIKMGTTRQWEAS